MPWLDFNSDFAHFLNFITFPILQASSIGYIWFLIGMGTKIFAK